MAGKIYGVGVGPGDPELLTIKAARLIKNAGVIGIPAEHKETCKAYQIAAGAAHTGQHWTADCTGDGSVVLEESETISTGAVSGNF